MSYSGRLNIGADKVATGMPTLGDGTSSSKRSNGVDSGKIRSAI